MSTAQTFTAFVGHRRIASGSLADIAPKFKAASEAGQSHLLVFDDTTGRPVELDVLGSASKVAARVAADTAPAAGRGRPKLGVTSREVTLLPSHWEWLAAQPSGASATLRRLVDQARRAGPDRFKEAQDAAYRVISALAGDLYEFEEATRAFYAKDYVRFDAISAAWPQDIGDYVRGFVARVASSEAG